MQSGCLAAPCPTTHLAGECDALRGNRFTERQAVGLGSPADGVKVREVPCSVDPGVCTIQRTA